MKSGAAALIAGAIGFLVTMGLHPTGHSPEHAGLTIGVHALAIFSLICTTFGFTRFTQWLHDRKLTVDLGLVFFCFAAVAGALAATVSGILTPVLANIAADATADEQALWHIVFRYNFRLNGALTQVFIGATAFAMCAWSAHLVRKKSKGLGCIGLLIGAVALVALLSGRLRNNVHDVGLFAVGFAGWTIGVATVLLARARTDS